MSENYTHPGAQLSAILAILNMQLALPGKSKKALKRLQAFRGNARAAT
jgi:uncharacterized membrane protein YgaE (UPF0421/DUF939 family)